MEASDAKPASPEAVLPVVPGTTARLSFHYVPARGTADPIRLTLALTRVPTHIVEKKEYASSVYRATMRGVACTNGLVPRLCVYETPVTRAQVADAALSAPKHEIAAVAVGTHTHLHADGTAAGDVSLVPAPPTGPVTPQFVLCHTEPILRYLAHVCGINGTTVEEVVRIDMVIAQCYLLEREVLGSNWYALRDERSIGPGTLAAGKRAQFATDIFPELQALDGMLGVGCSQQPPSPRAPKGLRTFVRHLTIADIVCFSLLSLIVREYGGAALDRSENLQDFFERMGAM